MNCQNIAALLDDLANGEVDPQRRVGVDEHLAGCESCASAWRAVQTLRVRATRPQPRPRADLFERVMQRAAQLSPKAARRQFWLGTGFGGALAAGIALAALILGPVAQQPIGSAAQQITIALNETRDVHVAIGSPADLANAQIRVSWAGAVTLAGFEGQHEMRWSTDLDRGINMLSLPVTMRGLSGGRLLVELTHEDRHEIFVVDLSSAQRRPVA